MAGAKSGAGVVRSLGRKCALWNRILTGIGQDPPQKNKNIGFAANTRAGSSKSRRNPGHERPTPAKIPNGPLRSGLSTAGPAPR